MGNLFNGSALLKKMAAIPIYGENALKFFVSRNQESFESESWYIASGTQGLPRLSV